MEPKIEIKVARSDEELPKGINREVIVDFLFETMEKYGDSKSGLTKCLDYAFSKAEGKGGFVLIAYVDDELAGIFIENESGMSEYIPEHFFVHIGIVPKFRRLGLATKILQHAVELVPGDIACHIEYDNPIRALVENSLGFSSKYAEYRLIRNQ